VFKDESKLDINYVPPRLPHRDKELNFLKQLFKFAIERPGYMTQRVLITGKIGTGKTVLSQRFGIDICAEAEKRKINLKYVHVNCRECKGSLFLILSKVMGSLHPNFPKRGFSAEELLEMLLEALDSENVYLILTLDELESLIWKEGSDPIYNLTRVQESRLGKPQRLSLICILRDEFVLAKLDASTRSTLQRNIIRLKEYSKEQLFDILADRVELAFKKGAVPQETLDFIAELSAMEGGDARYAIELLWRAGKYADLHSSPQVLPEHVREAAVRIYPTVRKDALANLSLHEKLLLLAVARIFKNCDEASVSMGDLELEYAVVCEEFGEKPRGHTQIWKYVKSLSRLGVIKAFVSLAGTKGRTTMISLHKIPASELEKEILSILGVKIEN